MALTEIKAYVLNLYVGAESSGLILLNDPNNVHIGNLYFRHDNRPPAASTYENNFYTFHYRARDWPRIVDILRNEKPAYIAWFGSSGYVGTGTEPVGEGEIAAP
jgi:hypothetical protein